MSKQGREQNRTQRAAAIRAQQQRQENRKKLGIIAVIVVVLGAIIAAGVWLGGGGSEKDQADAHANITVKAGENSLLMGEDDAPTKVVVYEDFQCPFCREFEMSSRDFLQEYAADGDVQVEYRPFHLLANMPYSGRALNAFIAVLEADPRKALQLHDTLFDNQPYEQTSGSVTVDDIKGWVEDTGVSDDVVQAAGEDHQQWFDAARKAVDEAGVQGTPTVFVDGKQISGQSSVGQMADQLEQLIAERAKAK